MNAMTNDWKSNSVIGRIPAEWDVVSIGSLGTSYGGLSSKNKDDFGSGYPYITYRSVFDSSTIDLSRVDYVQVAEDEFQNTVAKGDLFFTISSETPGEIAMCSALLDDIGLAYLNSFCFGYRITDQMKFESNFARFLFRGQYFRSMVTKIAQGSTRYNISKNSVMKLQIPLPPLPEQHKIADILSTADEHISEAKSLIDKTKVLKQGLMQQLLTRGIGHTAFKDTEIGRIPAEWEVVQLIDAVDEFIVPMRDKPKELDGPIPWCRIEDIDGRYFHGSKDGKGVNNNTIKEMNLKIMPVGTVIASCSASLGVYAINTTPIITNQTFIGLVCSNRIDNTYLYYSLYGYTKRLISISAGTTIPYISRQKFEQFIISLPSLPEQRQIASILTAIDDQIDTYQAKLDALFRLKSGLMQQLLTGRIRVKT